MQTTDTTPVFGTSHFLPQGGIGVVQDRAIL
jgi:hypothetical protein